MQTGGELVDLNKTLFVATVRRIDCRKFKSMHFNYKVKGVRMAYKESFSEYYLRYLTNFHVFIIIILSNCCCIVTNVFNLIYKKDSEFI